ncbi:MAG: DUF2284 domain-containing protein [Candidatus Bathyarchaeia archaeon]
MNQIMDLNVLCRLAVELGADDAKLVSASKIVVRHWVMWKCRFGCEAYGRSLSCPPFTPTPEETEALLKEYNFGLIFRVKDREKLSKIVIELERRAFLEGYYYALGFTSGRCRLCEECNVSGGLCLKPREMRPSMESCGIDVFATAENAGFKLGVLKSSEESYYGIGLILIK